MQLIQAIPFGPILVIFRNRVYSDLFKRSHAMLTGLECNYYPDYKYNKR